MTPCTATLADELLSIDWSVMKIHILDGCQLTIAKVFDFTNKTAHAKLILSVKRNILRARKLVDQWTKISEVIEN